MAFSRSRVAWSWGDMLLSSSRSCSEIAPEEAETGGPASCRNAARLETVKTTCSRPCGNAHARTLDMARTRMSPRRDFTLHCAVQRGSTDIGATPDNRRQHRLPYRRGLQMWPER